MAQPRRGGGPQPQDTSPNPHVLQRSKDNDKEAFARFNAPIMAKPQALSVQDLETLVLIEDLYESRGNDRPRVTITVAPQNEQNPAPADIIIKDDVLAEQVRMQRAEGGTIRLLLSLPLRPTGGQGNPQTMCPCNVEP
jgi:hypothetical protein